ncbi:23S rRNA accumulation protein YceD [Idiomarina aminovorans]|uniref:23S rRNA accumulation protein YceD n=1 Tax=Idiomarina aminovorans TaxID=2914829 RepID=UPI0020061C92|nr:23S rRNA accumulation protein YceD [Idiomarina sp. ATCH4]MCK7458538.1 23S rRNA accumulation protein YceD [Idiomarina sp. ATCH4]
MQKLRIPITVDPVKSANKKLAYDGVVPGKTLKRLQESLVNSCPDPEATVEFGIDEQGISYFAGEAKVAVKVLCERCNTPLDVDILAQFAYAPVTKRQVADDFPDSYEAIEVNDFGEVNLHGLIEDELILAMPLAPKHDAKACQVDRDAMTWGEIDESVDEESDNPFAALQELKRK